MKIKPDDLPKWTAIANASGSFDVVDADGNQLFGRLDERTALIVASAPRTLRFLSLFTVNRGNAPAGLDVGRVLSLANIEIDHGSR